MLGYALLAIALVLYFRPGKRVYSIFLYFSFLVGGYQGGFGLTTDSVLGCKNLDLAVLYTLIILAVKILLRQKLFYAKDVVSRWILVFLAFIACSWVYSYVHYGFSFYQIFQASRFYLLIASFFILSRLSYQEVRRLISWLLFITAVTSVLYILQIVAGRPIMPYAYHYETDPSTGLIRLYNWPPLLAFFLILSFAAPDYFKRNLLFYRSLFFITLICTLGRTTIVMTLFGLLFVLYLKGGLKKAARYLILVGLCLIPFSGIITDRFVSGDTKNDLNEVLKGSYGSGYTNDGGTLTYRLAWIYERWDYLSGRPLSEQLFGLGFISDSDPRCHLMYNFRIGLLNKDTMMRAQLFTPDIAYGNLLTRLGLLGSAIYLVFIFFLIRQFYIFRKQSLLSLTAFVILIIMVFGSFSGSELSDPQSFSLYFVIYSLLLNDQFKKRAGRTDERETTARLTSQMPDR